MAKCPSFARFSIDNFVLQNVFEYVIIINGNLYGACERIFALRPAIYNIIVKSFS